MRLYRQTLNWPAAAIQNNDKYAKMAKFTSLKFTLPDKIKDKNWYTPS